MVSSAQQSESRRGLGALFWEHRFVILLCAIAMLLVAAPTVNIISWRTRHSEAIMAGVFTVVLLALVFTVSTSRFSYVVAALLATPAIILDAVNLWLADERLSQAGHVFAGLLLLYATVCILRHLFHARRVTANTICASLCAYLLLGVLWALLYSAVCYLDPASFVSSQTASQVDTRLRFRDRQMVYALYYSLVTMTTLGYGDIVPTSAPARMMAVVQALTGQIYLAVLVARLVGIHIAQSMDRSDPGSAGSRGRP